MLPGLRILFAITFLSISVLIFGLGAAAYLRSAHDNLASTPWRPIEAPATARVDLAPATLAMLRVEPETAPALPADKLDAPATISAPAETKIPADPTGAAADATPPRAEQAAAPAPAKSDAPEPAAARVRETPPQPAQAIAAQTPGQARDAAAAPATAETKALEVTETKEPALPPVEVAALSTEKTEPPARNAAESAPLAATPTATEAPANAVAPTATAPGADTLKADDKAIEAAPAAKIAALGDPPLAEVAPLPSKDVKIPTPRLDPAVIEAQRKRLRAQQRARARAALARRLAAARARAAAQAKAAAASNPFGVPASTTAATN